MTSRYPAIATDITSLFAARNTHAVEVAILQPADPFLDMAGEDLRRRIFLTESETGQTLCLRPEFTIPVCLDHISSQAGTPRRYSYLGEVFRQRREGGNEFFQAGIEDLGDRDTAQADARSVADAHALLSLVLPGQSLTITLGDQTIFEAVLAALGLPRGWRMRLARAFGSAPMLQAALSDLANPPRNSQLSGDVATLVLDGDLEGLSAHIASGMEQAGLSASGGRAPADIARRLIEKAELRSVRLSNEAFAALKTFLAIEVPLDGAAQALENFAAGAGLSLGVALEKFAARARAIEAHGLPAAKIRYDAAFGRPLDYYTGVVFEIAAQGGERPLAGGGRYDRLLTLLGAKTAIPGVGFSVWLDRIETLRGDGTMITLAIPSKGRLKEQALEVLAKAGLSVSLPGDERKYHARVEGLDSVEVAFLSASEIAGEIGQGAVDLGITGEDLVRENLADWEAHAEIVARLGFGHADVVVAVPEIWLDVDTMADLDDVAADFRQRHGRRLRIATKYWRLTQQFFSQKHGIQVYRIVESLGATEGAPAAGLADVIVDITSSGSTLRANHLKVLGDGVVLKSQACLVAARKDRSVADEALVCEIAAKMASVST